MGLDEAREVLGISAGASPDEVRRAYMRAVKRYRPERDPEAFQRARAAYDLLRSPFAVFIQSLPNAERDVEPDVEPPVEPTDEAPTDEAPPPVTAAPVVDLSPWFAREAALPENARFEDRIAIWREAIEAGIPHALPSLRYAELVEATRPAEARTVLLAALRRELAVPELRGAASGRLLGWIAHRYARWLGEADLDALEARGDPASLAAAAFGHATAGSPEAAVPLLERALRGDAAAIGWTLTAVVRLFGADPALGRQAVRIVERHLGEAVDERTALQGAEATYAILSELAAVFDRIGPAAARGLARAIHGETNELEASLSTKSAADVEREHQRLQTIAPTLVHDAGWIYTRRIQTRPSSSSSSKSGIRWPVYLIGLALIQLFRFITPNTPTTSPPRTEQARIEEQARERQAPRPIGPWSASSKVVMRASSDQVAEMQRRIANVRRRSTDPGVVAELDLLAKGIDGEDCFELTASSRHVRSMLPDDDDAKGLLLLRDAVCAAPSGGRR